MKMSGATVIYHRILNFITLIFLMEKSTEYPYESGISAINWTVPAEKSYGLRMVFCDCGGGHFFA